VEAPRTEESILEQVKKVAGGAKNHIIYGLAQAAIATILGVVALKAAKYVGIPAYIFAAVAFSAPAFIILSGLASALGHCKIKIRW
jgi:hypothetical protein